jgi:hypothetical protein
MRKLELIVSELCKFVGQLWYQVNMLEQTYLAVKLMPFVPGQCSPELLPKNYICIYCGW